MPRTRTTDTTTPAFTGFPKGGDAFFLELYQRQDRDWFKANKAEYERLWEAPMHALFAELKARLAKAYPAVAKAEPKHFRIYRDVRFSKDKSPFKTNISAVIPLFPHGGEGIHGMAGFYAEFGKETFVAAGRWAMEPPMLARYRKAVDDEKTGKPLMALVEKAKKAGYQVSTMEALKRVPKPFDPEHPRAELLKPKGLALEFPGIPLALRYSPKLVDTLVAQAEAVAPLLHQLEKLAK